MSAVARDIVSTFGVLFAAGNIAIRLGVLPLNSRETGADVKRACLCTLAALPDPEAELRTDIAHLAQRLSGGGVVDADALSRKDVRLVCRADGFRRPRHLGQHYVVRAETFTSWFGSPPRTRRVLECLDDQGFLERGRERTNARSNEWAQRQVTWPDETRQRSISIYLPNDLADLQRDH